MHLIDLHVHSTVSDGTFTPREVAFYAKAKGLRAIALTDHDSIDGIEACLAAGKSVDLEVISGIELSAQYENTEIHILGYAIDPHSPYLLDTLHELLSAREARNTKMLSKFHDLGLSLTLEDLYSASENITVLTRAHFAVALVRKGYVKNMDEAFDKYLLSDRPCYVKRHTLSYKMCIDVIHKAGGLAVVAHPMLYGFPTIKYPSFIKHLADAGIDGIEAIYPKHSEVDSLRFLELCLQYNLVPTGGSDFHGTNKANIDIGVGFGATKVPYDVLEMLLSRKWDKEKM